MPTLNRTASGLSAIAAVIVAATFALAPVAQAQSHGDELCAPEGISVTSFGAIMNNVWNAETKQCLTFRSRETWEVSTSEHQAWGSLPAAYPATYYGCHWGGVCGQRYSTVPVPVYQVSTAPARWGFSGADAAGKWAATFDLWFHTDSQLRRPPDAAEITIWLDRAGGARPMGQRVATDVTIEGTTWDIYRLRRPGVPVLTYLRTTPTQQVADFDLYSFVKDAEHRGHIDPAWYWSAAEAGFMLWRDGVGLRSDRFVLYTEDDLNRPDYVPPQPPPPPAGPPPPGAQYCRVIATEHRRWTEGYITDPASWSRSPTSEYSAVLTLPPGQTLQGWWNVDVSYEDDQIRLEPLTYQGFAGEQTVTRFGFQVDTPPHDHPLDLPYRGPGCEAEFLPPTPPIG